MLWNYQLVVILFNLTLTLRKVKGEGESGGLGRIQLMEAKCDSPIYCPGKILDTIQRAQLFKDSKTFVDMPTSQPLEKVLVNFDRLGPNPSKTQLKEFVKLNFREVGSELVEVKLSGFQPNPKFLSSIQDPLLKAFAKEVHSFWSNLVRRQDLTKLCKGCVTSMLPTKHDFVVPGGRFREFYYWDTYFSLRGLLVGDLVETGKDLLLNFIEVINQFGFIPNGARIYFLNRSQPPLFASMVQVYFEKTKDIPLLIQAVPALDLEYKYWIQNHSVPVPCPPNRFKTLRKCALTRYYVHNQDPRPESYFEDYTTVELAFNLDSNQKADLYADLATGAETGWDYSTRWLSDVNNLSNATHEQVLRKLVTRHIVPVDLNSIMYQNEKVLSQLHSTLANHFQTSSKTKAQMHLRKAKFYWDQAQHRSQLMYHLLFDKQLKSYYDYDLTKKRLITRFSASNFWPYWTDAIPPQLVSDQQSLLKPFAYLELVNQKYIGGIPATLIDSKLQWDQPNSWPPLELVLIEATLNLADKLPTQNLLSKQKLDQLAFNLTSKFVTTVFCSWYQTGGSLPTLLPKLNSTNSVDLGHMFEKFNVTQVGRSGGGGEYEVQIGFGWTNGVLLTLIDKFNQRLIAPNFAKVCGK